MVARLCLARHTCFVLRESTCSNVPCSYGKSPRQEGTEQTDSKVVEGKWPSEQDQSSIYIWKGSEGVRKEKTSMAWQKAHLIGAEQLPLNRLVECLLSAVPKIERDDSLEWE